MCPTITCPIDLYMPFTTPVSEMTYTVSSGTLDTSIPRHIIPVYPSSRMLQFLASMQCVELSPWSTTNHTNYILDNPIFLKVFNPLTAYCFFVLVFLCSVCVCHVVIKIYLLTYLLTYIHSHICSFLQSFTLSQCQTTARAKIRELHWDGANGVTGMKFMV